MQSLIDRMRERFLPRARARMPDGPREHVRLTNPWHAVSVLAGPACCEAVTRFAGRRFLASGGRSHARAPSLPLPNCTAAQCRCRYLHHADRRHAPPADRHTGVAAITHPRRRADDTPAV
jgi:hypothetical protein